MGRIKDYSRPRRGRIITIRVTETEYQMVKKAAEALGVSIAEIWRRLLWTVVILYSDLLPATKALEIHLRNLGGKKLADIIKPFPELMKILDQEIERERAKKSRR